MNLYHLKGQTLASIAHEAFALERDLHQMIEANLDMLFGLTLVSSEFALGEFRLDTLAYDEENEAFVIIEYKKRHNASVIDQGYSYLSLMLNNKADFILEYNEKQGHTLKRSAVNWSSSKVMFISPSFSRYQKNSVNFKDIPFELWEVRRFDGGVISVDQVQAASKESVKQLTKSEESSVISEVSSEIIVYREEDHTASLSPALLEIWESLRAGLDDWPDGSFYATKPYIGFKRGNRTACFVRFQRNKLRIDISRGEKAEDGQPNSNFFSLNDYKKTAAKKSWTYKSGRTGHKYLLTLDKVDDVPYALELIGQKFKSL